MIVLFVYTLRCFLRGINIELVWFPVSFVIYFFVNLIIVFHESIRSENIVFISKIACVIFLPIILLTNLNDWDSVLFVLPVFISFALSLIPLAPPPTFWQEVAADEAKEPVKPYFFNFGILIIFYSMVSMIFVQKTFIQDPKLHLIYIWSYAGGLCVLFWLAFVIYRFVLKKTEFTRKIKVLIILALASSFYFLRNSIITFSDKLLLAADITGLISITIQNLILTRKRIKHQIIRYQPKEEEKKE